MLTQCPTSRMGCSIGRWEVDTLVIELTVSDPTLYKGPQRITMYYERIPEDEFLEYDCAAGLWYQALDAQARLERAQMRISAVTEYLSGWSATS